jgi:hypothetical protein
MDLFLQCNISWTSVLELSPQKVLPAFYSPFPVERGLMLDKYPVLLLHGLLQASGTFCVNDDSSLAFFLCKSGYDVWMGNNRGYFNPEHKTLKPSDPKFWSWNLQEMGSLDLPAMVSFVQTQTKHEKVPFRPTRLLILDRLGGPFPGSRTLFPRSIPRTSPAVGQISFLFRGSYARNLRWRSPPVLFVLVRENHDRPDLQDLFRYPRLHTVHVGYACIHSWSCIWLVGLSSVQFPLLMERFKLGTSFTKPILPIFSRLRQC